MKLDAIRLRRVTSGELVFYKSQADQDYEITFAQAGMGTLRDDPTTVAAAVKGSAIREALVAALDDWVVCAANQKRRDWLIRVARQADPDKDGWRDRIL